VDWTVNLTTDWTLDYDNYNTSRLKKGPWPWIATAGAAETT